MRPLHPRQGKFHFWSIYKTRYLLYFADQSFISDFLIDKSV